MDRKYSNLTRPPPKLRYFRSTDRSDSNKTRTVVRNIEDCFDELDSSPNSGSELSVLCPLPKTWILSEDAQEVVQSISVLPVMGSSENLLCNEESPSKDCVPETMSNRAGLVADNGDGDGEGHRHHRASPLLFENEDVVPETDDIKTVQSNKKSQMSRKDFEETSEDEWESPPKKFLLRKCPKAPSGSKGLEQRKAFCSSDEEFLSLQSKKVDVAPDIPSQKIQVSDEMTVTAPKPSAPPENLNIHPHPLEKDHKNTLMSKVKSLKKEENLQPSY
ncbi:hypothetical protein AAFF_G00002680 [Aldrovandia affinis]|uniref:Uncharacterized protein n=1 Tax=Aldrovandia affinis TaxID=143900 RepID=A0AAD7X4S8_9TELE|nr:hypothetical protein AAFF_G00002680 [Aldrovandia affinis]